MAELVPPWGLEAPLAHARPTGILGISLAPQQLSVLHPLRSPEEHRDGVTEIQTWKDAGTAGPEVEVGTALRWHRTPLVLATHFVWLPGACPSRRSFLPQAAPVLPPLSLHGVSRGCSWDPLSLPGWLTFPWL